MEIVRQPSRWAQVFDATNGGAKAVSVIEDSATGVNFIHPWVVQQCNLNPQRTARIVHKVISGNTFPSDEWVEVAWIGKHGRTGVDMFYVAPDGAPIDLLVGSRFLGDNKDVFFDVRPVEAALLNVQLKVSVGETQPFVSMEC